MVDASNEAAVRARAYRLWEASGRADGSQEAHWRQAEREVAERETAERAEAGEGQPGANGPAPARPQGGPGSHSDGMSRHPSVLDPGPGRPG